MTQHMIENILCARAQLRDRIENETKRYQMPQLGELMKNVYLHDRDGGRLCDYGQQYDVSCCSHL